jgi:quercetin dioxygenase-like cupin family protein
MTAPLRLDPAALADIAVGLGCAEPLWRAVVRHDEDRRPVRLLATEEYEAWVIGWRPDQSLDLHDHGESHGVLLVVEGELHERALVDGALVDATLAEGRLRWLPLGLVHAVAGAGDRPATSIHVYSPPLSQMTRFDDDLAPIGSDIVDDEVPVLPAASAGPLLHPSRRRATIGAHA